MTTGTLNKTPTSSAAVTEKTRTLTLQDRCDRCNAQAFIYAYKVTDSADFLEVFFCGHHGKRFTSDLENQGFTVEDSRDMINPKSESST